MTHKVIQAKRLIEAFLALMLGRRVPVHWDNRASMDNEGGVHLPLPQTGDASEIALLTRLAVHEGGHLLETEGGFADRLTQEELGVFNALEDPRVENRQVRRYPGASLVLSRGLEEMLQNIETNLEAPLNEAPNRAIQLDLLLRGFLAVAPHGSIARRGPGILDRLAPHINDAQRAAIDEAVARLPTLSTSLDAEDAARALLARLREQEPPPPSEAGNEGDSEDGEGDQHQSGPPEDGDNASADQEPQYPEAPDDAGTDQPDQQQDDGAADTHADSEAEGGAAGEPGADAQEDESAGGNADCKQARANDAPAGGASSDSAPGGGGSGSCQAGATSTESGGEAIAEQEGSSQPTGSEAASGQPGPGAPAAAADDDDEGEPEDAQAGGNSHQAHCNADGSDAEQGSEAPGSGGEALDLGALLRETLVARYGCSEADAADRDGNGGTAAEPLSDEELERVELMLATADPSAPLEELVQASLAALAAGEAAQPEDSSPGDGAGMCLASGTAEPRNLAETRLQGVQSQLVTVLQRALQDRRRRPTRAAYAGGRVMTQRFWRLGTLGDTKVFVQKRDASGIDAAATVLLDSSYSMKEQLRVAAEVAMAFSLAMQRLGVRTRLVRFPGSETVTETLQRFGESPRNCVHRCAALVADGGTPIGAATAAEAPLLMAQRKLKNILVLVTDDDPGDKETLAAALARAQEFDVLVVGVGIGCDIRAWIPNSVMVRDVNELPAALARLFRESISEKLAA